MGTISLTDEQKAIVDFDRSFVAIAKPGSGKTAVLAAFIKRILSKTSAHQGLIAISYTNKASNELRRRSLGDGTDAKGSFFGTIDKFCDSEIIIPFLSQLWGRPNKDVAITKLSDLTDEDLDGLEKIDYSSVDDKYIARNIDALRKWFAEGFLFLETNGALASYTIDRSKSCRRYIKTKYTHILIDEYQDSGFEQHKLFLQLKDLGLVAGAVGDPDQSIFGFSGKDPKFLLSLAKNEDFQSFPISINHRSHPSIINYSLKLIDTNAVLIETEKTQVYYKKCGNHITDICRWIENNLQQITARFEIENSSDIGILVRGNSTGALVDNYLSVPHKYFKTHPLENHLSIWAKLFSTLLYYRFNSIYTIQDIIDEFVTRKTSIRTRSLKQSIKRIRSYSSIDMYDYMVQIANEINPQAYSSEAVELLKETEFEDLESFFQTATNSEIQIMSIHKSKGLEFDVVFHLDLYEWVLPIKAPGPNQDWNNPIYPSWDQDLNLHYVAITRARKACIFCLANKRINSAGNEKNANDSEFLWVNNLQDLRKEL